MSATATRVQEGTWSNFGYRDKGVAAYLASNVRAVANTVTITAQSRGTANTFPTILRRQDADASALEALAIGLGRNLKSEADEKLAAALPKTDHVTEAALAALVSAIQHPKALPSTSIVPTSERRPLSASMSLWGPSVRFDVNEALEPTFIIGRDTTMPTWITTDKVIAGLLGLIATLISVVYLNMKSDIDDLKKFSLETPKQISDLKVSLTNAIKDVEKQAAVTNSRLDLILEELKRPQRR